MSPTSYQTAPPRSSIINNDYEAVKHTTALRRPDPSNQHAPRLHCAPNQGARYEEELTSRLNRIPLPILGIDLESSFRNTILTSLSSKEKIIYGQKRSKRESSCRGARDFECAAPDSPACCRDSEVRNRFAYVASRTGRAGSP